MALVPSLLLLFLISEGAVCSVAAAAGGYKPTGTVALRGNPFHDEHDTY